MSDQTLRGLWLRARATLAGLPKDEARRDARLLIQEALRLDPSRFVTGLGDPVTAPQGALDHLDWMLARRAARWPVSLILGRAPFWGRDFEVTRDTLAPRGDTETLVAEALCAPFQTALDIGTGTGCIAVTLAAERPGARMTATDISPAALEVAIRNAVAHGVADRVTYLETEWAAGISGPFDLVVCNPPYIDEQTWAGLAPEVRDHEPKLALSPGGDGLDPYRILAPCMARLLAANGRVLMEIGHDQGAAVSALFMAAGLSEVRVIQDFAGKDRVVSACAAMPRLSA